MRKKSQLIFIYILSLFIIYIIPRALIQIFCTLIFSNIILKAENLMSIFIQKKKKFFFNNLNQDYLQMIATLVEE